MAHADSLSDLNDIDADWDAGDPAVDEAPRSGARGVVLADPDLDGPSSAPASRVTTVRTRRIEVESSARHGVRGRVVLAAVACAFALGSVLGALVMSSVAPRGLAARNAAPSAQPPTIESALPMATASPSTLSPPSLAPKSAATPRPVASSPPGPRPLHPALSRPAPSARPLEAPAKK